MKRILYIALTAAMLAGCTKESPTEGDKTAVQFNANIAASRASGTSWAPSDAIGVYMMKSTQGLGATTIVGGVDNFKQITTGGDGKFASATTAEAVYFPLDGAAVDFIAYYPYQTTITDYSYPIDLSVQRDQSAIDLLYSANATSKSKTDPSVALFFTHQLVKVEVNLSAGAGLNETDLAGAIVMLTNQKTSGAMSLATGVITPSATQTLAPLPLKMSNDSKKAEAIIMPAEAGLGYELQFTLVDGTLLTYAIPATTPFESGTKHLYNATLDRKGVTITSQNITDWTSGNGTGEDGIATDPWVKMPIVIPNTNKEALKAAVIQKGGKEYIYIYVGTNGYKAEISQYGHLSWSAIHKSENFPTVPFTSLVAFKENLYATHNNKIYSCEKDGEWNEINFGNDVQILLAAFPENSKSTNIDVVGIAGVSEDKFSITNNTASAWLTSKNAVPSDFPKYATISSIVYLDPRNVQTAMVVGESSSDDGKVVPWLTQDGVAWTPLISSNFSTLQLKNPSFFRYNDTFYTFGYPFTAIYKSVTGNTWVEAGDKFKLPEEFKNKDASTSYSVVASQHNHIWILFGDGDVWRVTLSQIL